MMSEFFVPEFDTQSKRACIEWVQGEYDHYDPWGFAMSWLFDISAELYNRGAYDLPNCLSYCPGSFGPETSEFRAEGLSELSTESLEYAARVLSRLEQCCRNRGMSY